ncbi:hypothetical protein [Ewingella americana]|jgi:hypothetical protein|uniref:hypothetical protein n=1 Tax=Ewingella americana TaxID=41202 RepID=UPI001386AC71|nr:hypothetical protein [Ewingella americana]
MKRTVEKIESDLIRARRERDTWKGGRNGRQNVEMVKKYISSLEKELAESLKPEADNA